MKKSIVTLALCALLMSLVSPAQTAAPYSVLTHNTTAREELDATPWLAGSNYLDYDRQLPSFKYTHAPKGYEPFYMSHYGRHGSRWLIGRDDYERVLRPLRKARQQGKLTREGQETLRLLELFNKGTHQRLGDLSTVGERQHHGIGRRLTEHFPEIFLAKGVPIDARSTNVPRCILSMIAECEELMAANPTARIHNDVSQSLQYYLNQQWEGRVKEQGDKGNPVRDEFSRRHTHPDRLMGVLFTDRQWAKDSIDEHRLMRQLFEVAINMQSHDEAPDLLHLFTADEIYDQWRIENVGWYQRYGPSPFTGSIMPFSQYNLLDNIIHTADTCVALGKTQATLRFGHEVCVMPLACLMELDSCGVVVDDMEQLDAHWRNYRIFPMGCNIQLIFYRQKKGGGEVLMKALLNEREVSLPVLTTQWPYYRWRDVREYWSQKLRRFANDK